MRTFEVSEAKPLSDERWLNDGNLTDLLGIYGQTIIQLGFNEQQSTGKHL